MILAIIGSRNAPNTIDIAKLLKKHPTEIVSGGARGADTLAKEFAEANNIMLKEFLPNYKEYGRRAPLLRDKQIVEYADCVLAIWDGMSAGTKYTLTYAHSLKKPIKIYYYKT